MSKILKELKDRGILNNITNEEKLNKLPEGAGIYIGFDPTATSLHLGNYIQISILQKFKAAGFNPIAIVGGATGMIGDPSGKSAERNLLDNNTLLDNKKKIKKQLKSFDLKVVDNLDFYKNVNILDFLRTAGKLLNVNYMINKEIVKSRLESGISFTEFSYQLIQGWDFKCLYDQYNVSIQVGGSDQWGNITSGIEMIRKTIGDDNLALGITTNLMLAANGKKFGKSEGNAIFLDAELTSPFEMYQYLFNTPDADVEKFLLWLTLHPISKVDQIMQIHNTDTRARKAQKELAYAIVSDIHGAEEAENAMALTGVLFAGGDVTELTDDQVLSLDGSVPTSLGIQGNIQDVLVEIKAASSKREAREFISKGAVNVNGKVITDDTFEVVPEAFNKKATLIKRGKKKFFLIKH